MNPTPKLLNNIRAFLLVLFGLILGLVLGQRIIMPHNSVLLLLVVGLIFNLVEKALKQKTTKGPRDIG